MNRDWKRIVLWALVIALGFVFSFLAGYRHAVSRPVEPLSRDTVVITRIDTIAREKPVYYAVRQTDTLRVVVRDTVRQQDTLYLELRREQRAYRDTSFEAWVSGVEPALDSIRVFAPVRCVTVTERVPVKVRTRWGLGVSAGYGITLTKEPRLTPYLGVGISYNIVSW